MYFLVSIVRLFGPLSQNSNDLGNLRESVTEINSGDDRIPLPQLLLEKECDESLLPVSIFCSALNSIEPCAKTYINVLTNAESETIAHITQILARLKPKHKNGKSFPASLLVLVLTVSNRVAQTCSNNSDRMPLRRRARGKAGDGERRKEKDTKDRTAKEKRHKNHAWLEQEQSTMN